MENERLLHLSVVGKTNENKSTMKHIGINEPCSENWNKMSPTEKGAFCQKCATQVYDFTQKSNEEIKQTLRSLIGQPVCGRITATQETTLNAEFIAWSASSSRSFQSRMVFSLVVVFGLSLFSCTHEQDKKKIVALQERAMQAIQEQAVVEQPIEDDAPKPIVAPVVAEQLPFVLELPEPIELTEVQLVEPFTKELPEIDEVDRGYAGGISYNRHYERFLLDEATPLQELDENNRPFPTAFASLVYPNPVSTTTTFELSIPEKTKCEIGLYDLNGKFIQHVYQGKIERGTFKKDLDLTNYTPGIYLIIVQSKEYKETIRVSKI